MAEPALFKIAGSKINMKPIFFKMKSFKDKHQFKLRSCNSFNYMSEIHTQQTKPMLYSSSSFFSKPYF